MPESEKPSLIEKLTQSVVQRAAGGITQYVERFVKRTLRVTGLVLAGVAIALLGITFLSIGVVKWFSLLMPSWLAWVIVGVVMLLLGLVLTLVTLISLRS